MSYAGNVAGINVSSNNPLETGKGVTFNFSLESKTKNQDLPTFFARLEVSLTVKEAKKLSKLLRKAAKCRKKQERQLDIAYAVEANGFLKDISEAVEEPKESEEDDEGFRPIPTDTQTQQIQQTLAELESSDWVDCGAQPKENDGRYNDGGFP